MLSLTPEMRNIILNTLWKAIRKRAFKESVRHNKTVVFEEELGWFIVIS